MRMQKTGSLGRLSVLRVENKKIPKKVNER